MMHRQKTSRKTISLIKVKTYNTLLCVFLLCILSYLILILRYKYVFDLILDIYHQNTLYLREKRCEGSMVIFKAQSFPRVKRIGKTLF